MSEPRDSSEWAEIEGDQSGEEARMVSEIMTDACPVCDGKGCVECDGTGDNITRSGSRPRLLRRRKEEET